MSVSRSADSPKEVCTEALSTYMECVSDIAYSTVQAGFVFSKSSNGTFVLDVAIPNAPASASAKNFTFPLDSPVQQILQTLRAADPWLAMTVLNVTRRAVAFPVGGFQLDIIMNANMTEAVVSGRAPINAYFVDTAQLDATMSSAISGVFASTFFVLALPLPLAMANATSQCCREATNMTLSCNHFKFEDPTSPLYPFPFPVDINSPLVQFAKNLTDVCPCKLKGAWLAR